MEVSGQYEFGFTSLRPDAEATTCDDHYKDNGRACAWFTFMCEDITSAMDVLPTCFKGASQSPIDLNRNGATPGDPGAISFQGYNFEPSQAQAVLRIQNFALQLDYEPTVAPASSTRQRQNSRSKRKKDAKEKKRKNSEKKKLEKAEKRENLVNFILEDPLRDLQQETRVKRGADVLPSIAGNILGSDL